MTEKEKQKRPGFMKRTFRLIQHLQNRIAMNRRRFILYSILRILVIFMMIRCFILGEYENVALCVLSLDSISGYRCFLSQSSTSLSMLHGFSVKFRTIMFLSRAGIRCCTP